MYNYLHTSHLVHLYRHRRDERRKRGGSHVSPPELLVYKITTNKRATNSEQMGSHLDIWWLQLSSIGLLRNLLCLVPRSVSEASQVCNIVSPLIPATFTTPPSTPSRT